MNNIRIKKIGPLPMSADPLKNILLIRGIEQIKMITIDSDNIVVLQPTDESVDIAALKYFSDKEGTREYICFRNPYPVEKTEWKKEDYLPLGIEI